jgi:hypothetical protein
MRFSMGLWDWLFGEKIEMELPNGQRRMVTKRWMKAMEQQGLIRSVAPEDDTIRVHSIGKTPDFGDDIHALDEWLGNGGKTYTIESWTVGVDIPQDQVNKWRDNETGDLYVVYQIVDGKWTFAYCKREVWQRFKSARDA